MDCVKLLQAYFKKETLKFEGDFKEELKKHNEQSLAPFLYYVYGDVFYKVYLGALLIQEKFYKIQSYITKLFNENNIDHFYTKGSIVSRYFDDSALRTRGDIDVLVKEEEFEKAKEVLLNNGFKFYEAASHHIELTYNNMLVELHKELYEKSRKDYDYFKDCFNNIVRVDKNYCELEINYHYLYLISHFNKHLTSGEGLRYLLDFYYVSKKNNLYFDYINKELEKLNLKKLHISIVNAIYYITNEWITDCEKIDVLEFIDYMQNSGIHSGTSSINKDTLVLNEGGKFKRLWRTVFLTDKEFRMTLYPKLSKHIIFYPIIVIRRLCYLLKHKFKKGINTLKTDKEYMKKQEYIYNKYGIVKTRK